MTDLAQAFFSFQERKKEIFASIFIYPEYLLLYNAIWLVAVKVSIILLGVHVPEVGVHNISFSMPAHLTMTVLKTSEYKGSNWLMGVNCKAYTMQ